MLQYFATHVDKRCQQVLKLPTKYRNRVRRRRHRLTDAQQEDDECQEDGDLEVHLLAGLDRQEEAEERDEKDEEARSDEVDDVEEAAATHVDRERHVRVDFRAACVRLFVALGRDASYHVHRPFLHKVPCPFSVKR